MGYDMYFAGKSYRDGDDVYFRLNIFGMDRYREYMADRGMVFDAGGPPGDPFVKADDETVEDYYSLRYPEDYPGRDLTPERRAAAEEYARQVTAYLSWHGPEIPGIPAHKFCSNDGWIVTPAECAAAVRLGREHPPPADEPDYWAKWLDYLDRASRAGGFEVH